MRAPRLAGCAALALAVTLAAGLAACQPSSGGSFDQKVKAYLMAHPEELRAALENMQSSEEQTAEKKETDALAKARLALPKLRAALERDPRDFVANPMGKVTVTEFYDFQCVHCINIAPKLIGLIRTRPDVRFVFKDLVIFGPTSEHAALAAMAAKAQGKDVLGLYQDFMSTHPLTDADIDRLAAARGVDVAALGAPAVRAKAEARLADVADLANKLAIDGTPGFVVGDQIIEGEDYPAILAAIAKAEKRA